MAIDLSARVHARERRGSKLDSQARSKRCSSGWSTSVSWSTTSRPHVAVEDIDAVVGGLRAHGAELAGRLERYEDSYRLCYVRG